MLSFVKETVKLVYMTHVELLRKEQTKFYSNQATGIPIQKYKPNHEFITSNFARSSSKITNLVCGLFDYLQIVGVELNIERDQRDNLFLVQLFGEVF